MTTESFNRIELDDVVRVSYECTKCGAVLALKAKKWSAQTVCPECRTDWAHQETPTYEALQRLAHGFHTLVRLKAELPFVLRLEVTDAKG